MGRAKIKRGSTNIDMTAMCDVAFLLLSFFILTTKFKPDEAVEIATPSSVAAKAAPEDKSFLVNINKEGKIFLQMSEDIRADILDELGTAKGINFSADDKKFFNAASYVGTPLSQMNQFNRIPPDDKKNFNVTGIPVDSTNNELQAWINAAVNAYRGRTINFLIKGDNNAKYPAFKAVIESFKKNEVFKYQLVTQPEGVPEGSALAEKVKALDPNADD